MAGVTDIDVGDRIRPHTGERAWGIVIGVRQEPLRQERPRTDEARIITAVYVQWPTAEQIQEALMTESVSSGGPETTTSQDGTDGGGTAGSGAGNIRAAQPGEGSVIGESQGVTAEGQPASPAPGDAGHTLDTDASGHVNTTDEEAGR